MEHNDVTDNCGSFSYWSDFYGMEECKMSHSGDHGRISGIWECKRYSSRDPKSLRTWGGGCEKDLRVAGKMSWYQQWDFQSLIMEFSDGKLKQKV